MIIMIVTEEDKAAKDEQNIRDLFEDSRDNKWALRNTDGPPKMKAKAERAINKMKEGKAVRPDDITIEMIIALKTGTYTSRNETPMVCGTTQENKCHRLLRF